MGPTGQNHAVSRVVFHSGDSREGSGAKFIQFVSRSQFLLAIGVRAPFSHRWMAGDHSQLLVVTPRCSSPGLHLSSEQPFSHVKFLSCFESLTFPSAANYITYSVFIGFV